MSRQVTPAVREDIEQWEGKVLFAYDDADSPNTRRKIKVGDKVRGTLTLSSGHTGPDVKPGMVITEAQADALLDRDLDRFEAVVDRLVKVPLTNNQFGVLVSFAFNAGEGAFAGSTLLKKLNRGDAAVPGELAKWNKTTIGGKKVVSQGLVNRRAAEAGLCAKDGFVSSANVDPVKETPSWVTPESIASAGGLLTGAAGVASGSGPVQWALGAVLVIAAATAAFYFIRRRAAAS